MIVPHANTIANVATLLLICFGSGKPAVAWVLPEQCQSHKLSRHRRGPDYVCYERVVNKEGSAEQDNNNNAKNVDVWEHQVIRWVDGILEQKSEQSPFAIESLPVCNSYEAKKNALPYEWIVTPDDSDGATSSTEQQPGHRNVALRTTGTPLLDAESIALIRGAAQNLWECQISETPSAQRAPSSRFTLQFEDTNSECHLDDLVASDASGKLQQIVDDLLTTRVYPLVRSAFGSDDDCNEDKDNNRYELTDGSLCVYDSLVVRYNGDKVTDRFGASQPLHGDGGVVSVNIALNSHRNEGSKEADTFIGGDTFFEDLIRLADDENSNKNHGNNNDNGSILRPASTGHALAHWSTHRHAGAPTRSGTRDILVIFLTQRRVETESTKSKPSPLFNGIERSFQLKLKARELPIVHRDMALRCLDLAIQESPFDAQAHFWKGFHLIQGGPQHENDADEEQQRWQEIHRSVYHFELAKECAPFDAKISCFTGTAYRQRYMFAQKNQREPPGQGFSHARDEDDLLRAASCLERALLLHENYRTHGISSDFEDNAITARLTLGEVYMQLERYGDAISCLSSIFESSSDETEKEPSPSSEAMRQHIAMLIDHCHHQQQKDGNDEHRTEILVAGT